MVKKEHIIAEIQRTAKQNDGKPLGRGRFAEATGIREHDWLGKYWVRWGEAVLEAGLKPNAMNSRFSDDEVLAKLVQETRRIGRLPTYAEIKIRRRDDPVFPSKGVYERFGAKSDLIDRLINYCDERPDLTDVREILAGQQVPLASSTRDSRSIKEPSFGFVYLLKSGKHYKIGRTNSLGRREYELAIQLPEAATRVHAIKTDDPAGIEDYWHRRFADKRRNGEWFNLDGTDVSAFKRRKFM